MDRIAPLGSQPTLKPISQRPTFKPMTSGPTLKPLVSNPTFTPLTPEAAQPKPVPVEQEGAREDVALQFTSMLMSMVVKEMWKTTDLDGDGSGPFGTGPGADIYRGLAETAFAEAMARNGMESLTQEVEKYIRSSKPEPEAKP